MNRAQIASETTLAPAATSTAAQFTLERDAWGHLVLVDETGRHENVTAQAIFPLADPERWISLCSTSGRELVLIEDPSRLPDETRQRLAEELRQRAFVPVIQRIIRTSGHATPCEWQVETDRGPTKFVLKAEDDVRALGDGKVLLHDANGVRYLISDCEALDAKSRRIIEWYV